MTEAQNTQIVKEAYEAFLRGDVPGILARIDRDVVWHGAVGGDDLPTGGLRHGTDAVGQFFQQVGETLEFETFEPREFVAERDKVITLGHYAGRVRATGRRFETDWVMVFTIRDGKVTEFTEFTDSRQMVGAFGVAAV